MMDVPSFIRLVRTAAAAKIVTGSGWAPPKVIQAASIPFSSASTMASTACGAVASRMCTPIRRSFMGNILAG